MNLDCLPEIKLSFSGKHPIPKEWVDCHERFLYKATCEDQTIVFEKGLSFGQVWLNKSIWGLWTEIDTMKRTEILDFEDELIDVLNKCEKEDYFQVLTDVFKKHKYLPNPGHTFDHRFYPVVPLSRAFENAKNSEGNEVIFS
ncbi:MAG: hypothetical protein ACRDBG_25150 [Waterburya sp.]